MSREYSEDHLVQETTVEFMEKELGWESVYAYNSEEFGEEGGRGAKGRGRGGSHAHLAFKAHGAEPGSSR